MVMALFFAEAPTAVRIIPVTHKPKAVYTIVCLRVRSSLFRAIGPPIRIVPSDNPIKVSPIIKVALDFFIDEVGSR